LVPLSSSTKRSGVALMPRISGTGGISPADPLMNFWTIVVASSASMPVSIPLCASSSTSQKLAGDCSTVFVIVSQIV
jgi:hypothetical protein